MGANKCSLIAFSDAGRGEVPASLYFHNTNPAACGFVLYIEIVKFHMT
jgi:hypothetical protein